MIDIWSSAAQASSRSQAIRRLVELGLTVKGKPRPAADSKTLRAKQSATKAVDKIVYTGASADDQANRKRELSKGPEAFRAVRVDRPKAKK